MPITQYRLLASVNAGLTYMRAMYGVEAFIKSYEPSPKQPETTMTGEQMRLAIYYHVLQTMPGPDVLKTLIKEEAHFSARTINQNEGARSRQQRQRLNLTAGQVMAKTAVATGQFAPSNYTPLRETDIEYYARTGMVRAHPPEPQPEPMPEPTPNTQAPVEEVTDFSEYKDGLRPGVTTEPVLPPTLDAWADTEESNQDTKSSQ